MDERITATKDATLYHMLFWDLCLYSHFSVDSSMHSFTFIWLQMLHLLVHILVAGAALAVQQGKSVCFRIITACACEMNFYFLYMYDCDSFTFVS